MTRSRIRGKNLDDQMIETIVGILDGWTKSKLTWKLLIEQISVRLHVKYTRQALSSHVRIIETFNYCKKKLSSVELNKFQNFDPELKLAKQRILLLEAEVGRLKRENNNLLEQFNRWIYNAYTNQLDNKFRELLNEPLPPVYREPTINKSPK